MPSEVTCDKIIEAICYQASDEYARMQREIYTRMEARDRMFNSLLFIMAATIAGVAWIVRPTGNENLAIFVLQDIHPVSFHLFLIAMILSGSSLLSCAICRGFLESNAHMYAAAKYVRERVIAPVQNLLDESSRNIADCSYPIKIPRWDWEHFIRNARKKYGFSDKSGGSVFALLLIVFLFLCISVVIDVALIADLWHHSPWPQVYGSFTSMEGLLLRSGLIMVVLIISLIASQVYSFIILYGCWKLQSQNEDYIKIVAEGG